MRALHKQKRTPASRLAIAAYYKCHIVILETRQCFSSSSLIPLPVSNGFAVVMSKNRFARVAIPNVVAIFASVAYVDVHTLMLLKHTENIAIFAMLRSM
jgi:hypothetical protein